MSARKRPLYARMLRLRHLKLRPAVAFLLFEGSIGLGVLLALADFVNGWGIVAVPVTVAVMVKLNDIVAGALAQVPHVAPVGVPPVVSAEAPVPPQSRATPPGRGASMRRTRAIVGRARLGSARGIVYVHPKPPEPRRAGSASETAAVPVPGAPPQRDPQAVEPPPPAVRAGGGVESGRRGEESREGGSSGQASSGRGLSGRGSSGRGEGSPDSVPAPPPEEPPDADPGLELAAADVAREDAGDPAVRPRETDRPNPDRGSERTVPDRTDRNKGRFA